MIIDSLRAYCPKAEKDNTSAAEFINTLRTLAKRHGTAFLFIHHVKKPDEKNGVVPLKDCSRVMDWLNQASGARSLINQSDFRLGIDDAYANDAIPTRIEDRAALVIRGVRRVLGETGLIYLVRRLDEDGDPIGYDRLSGIDFLNKAQREVFDGLPSAFTFKQAKEMYERQDQATTDFLRKCMEAGILRKVAKGRYEKVGWPWPARCTLQRPRQAPFVLPSSWVRGTYGQAPINRCNRHGRLRSRPRSLSNALGWLPSCRWTRPRSVAQSLDSLQIEALAAW